MMNKAEKKKYTSMSKKLIFVQTYTKFVVVMTKSKIMDAVDISKIYANDK